MNAMHTYQAPAAHLAWSEADVCGVWLSFASGETSNSLELTRVPGEHACTLDLALQEGSFRRMAHREPPARFGANLISFLVECTAGWASRSRSAADASHTFTWSLSLTNADGVPLRECAGEGLIPDAPHFFTLAHALDSVSRGFMLGVGPLAEIDRALKHLNIDAYDPELDAAAGGLIALAIGKEYLAEASLVPSVHHRAQSLAAARAYYKKASEAGSAQALAHLGLMDLGADGARNTARARHRFELASSLGSAEGCTLLADLIAEGEADDCDEQQALELYERGYELAQQHFDPGALGLASERLAQALASGIAGKPDLSRARDLTVEAELALSSALAAGEAWLAPSLERAQALSERLARIEVEISEP